MQFLVKVSAIVLLGLVFVIWPIESHELVNIDCYAYPDYCKNFEDPINNITAVCKYRDCECAKNGIPFHCLPIDQLSKMNNIISGHCPCDMRFSVCRNETCYCVEGMIASMDLRRCLTKQAALNFHCDFDTQCQEYDHFSVCNKSTANGRICNCREGYHAVDGKCLSRVGYDHNLKCMSRSQCDKFGHALCPLGKNFCVCRPGWISSPNISKCIPPTEEFDSERACKINEQCQFKMGWGAECRNEMCLCRQGYYETLEEQDDESFKIKCIKKPEFGDYCYTDEDCNYKGIFGRSFHLYCYLGRCKCRFRFNVPKGDCAFGRGYITSANLSLVYLGLVVFILKSFFV